MVKFYKGNCLIIKADEGTTDNELIGCVTTEIVSQIKKAQTSNVSIYFGRVDYNTVRILIPGIFETKLTLHVCLYADVPFSFNEHYDGYHDTEEVVYRCRETLSLLNLVSTLRNNIQNQLPHVVIRTI